MHELGIHPGALSRQFPHPRRSFEDEVDQHATGGPGSFAAGLAFFHHQHPQPSLVQFNRQRQPDDARTNDDRVPVLHVVHSISARPPSPQRITVQVFGCRSQFRSSPPSSVFPRAPCGYGVDFHLRPRTQNAIDSNSYLTNNKLYSPLQPAATLMPEGEQPQVYQPEPQSNVGKWILIALAAAYVGGSLFFIYTLHGNLRKAAQDHAASEKQVADLTKRMPSP